MATGSAEASSIATPSAGEEAEAQPSIWELIDEAFGVDSRTLIKYINGALAILLTIGGILIWNAYQRGDSTHILLHLGFVVLVLCLGATVNWVLHEAGRLQAEQQGSDKKNE